jgi:polyisoprenoid-binding protein YceI
MKPKRLSPAALLLGLLVQGGGQAAEYDRLLADRSTLDFTVQEMGVPVPGRFNKLSVRIRFDPARPELAEANLEIDLASIDAGSEEANEAVVGLDWLDVRHYPVARFIATALRPVGGDRYQITGRLTLKGRSRELTIPVRLQAQEGLVMLEGETVLRRADFAIGSGQWADFDTVANQIPVHFRLVVGSTPRGSGPLGRSPPSTSGASP